MLAQLRPALFVFVVLTLLTGVVYPIAVAGFAQLAFAEQAQGSLMRRGDAIVGSALLGQAFTAPHYFWGRPSATAPQPYNGAASGGSNLAVSNPALVDAVRERVARLRAADPGSSQPVPIDLVTASGSGLDPHVSIAGALYQVPRVARERKLDESTVRALVERHSARPLAGFLGEPRVHVLSLNVALDAMR